MKRIYLSIIALSISLLSFSQTPNIVGIWTGNDETNDFGSFEFKSDSSAIMTQDGEITAQFKYIFDVTKDPHWIDLITTQDGVDYTLYGLIRFIDDNTIKLELFLGLTGDHPIKFTNEGNELSNSIIILKREK